MSPQDLVRILRRYWLLTVSMLLLGLLSGAIASLLVTPLYTATSRVFVAVVSPSGSVVDLSQGGTFAEKMVDSYGEVATSPRVLKPVISDLGLKTTVQDLERRISVDTSSSSVVMSVSASDPSPTQAARIATQVTTQLSTVVTDLTPGTKDSAVRISSIADAERPTSPSSPNLPINMLVGAIIGLLVAGALIGLRRLVINKVDTVEDLAALAEVPVVGEIVRDRSLAQGAIPMLSDPFGGFAESVRDLRTNLQYLTVAEQAQTVVITSAAAGDGKTTTALNLALALSAAQSVALVDADLRKPRVAEALGIDGTVGLTDVLIGRATLEQALQPVGDGNLVVLPAGNRPPNAAELLQSDAMKHLIEELSERFGTVLFDTAPAGILSDARVLARECSGALVVCAIRRSKRSLMRAALVGLERSGANTLGLIATFTPARGSAYTYEHADVTQGTKPQAPRLRRLAEGQATGQSS